MRIILTLLALAVAVTAAHATRAQRQWGGADFPFSCDLVRQYRAEIAAMSPEAREVWTQRLHVTPKMQRQARACLR